MTTPEIKAQVDSLILKAEEHNLVQSVKQIFKVLGAAGMMYELKIPPMLIGCHPSNRDGYGINPNDVHRLISDIFTLGFDHGEVKAVCSEIDPAEAAKVQAWNDKMIQESAGKLGPLECDLRYATLWGGHTNQCLRAVAAGLVHEDERLVAGGKLNLQKIAATDPIFAEAAVGGVQWQVLSHKVFQIWPTLADIIQSAGNASGQVATHEHELQVLRKLWVAYKREASLSAGAVQFVNVKKHVAKSKPPCLPCLPAMYQYVLKYSGGTDALFLLESELYIKSQSASNVNLSMEMWEALALDYKGIDQALRFRHGLLKLLYVKSSSVKVSHVDIRKCGSKEMLPKVITANHFMVEVQQFLQQNHMIKMQSTARCGQFDIAIVEMVLGKSKETDMQLLAHQLVEDLKTALNMPTIVSPWASSAPVIDPNALNQPSSGVMLREFSSDAKLKDPSLMLVEKGFAVGVSVMHKEDKTMACIQKMQGSTVQLRTASGVMDVDVSLLLDKVWIKRESHNDEPDEIQCWQQHVPLASLDFRHAHIKAAIIREIYELTNAHSVPVDLKLFNKPRNVIATTKFDKGKLVLVPSTTRVGTTSEAKLPVGSFCVGQFEKVMFTVSPLITMPGTKAQPFLAPYWFVQCSSDPEEINMEIFWKQHTVPDNGIIRIPLMRNMKQVKQGDRLTIANFTDEDNGLAAVVGDAKGGKKAKGAVSGDPPSKKGKKAN